ncbi:MAG TPA: ATP-binding protein, partial [Nevskiaceae bacterium]|nr:ATP-binding protein [Nevskiaceae bacterium]
WEQEELPDPSLDEGHALHLFRIMREAVTNALRHGQATRVRVRVKRHAAMLMMDVADDGPGAPLPDADPGRGMENMKARAAELHGTIAWNPATSGGTKVVLQFPMPENAG